MLLTDLSVKRPVFALVVSLLLLAFGVISFIQLPLRQYPDINPPVVLIETSYQGAAAPIIETRITQLVEDAVSGVEGIKHIASSSSDGQSRVTIEFTLTRDVDDAANDIRDRIGRVANTMPDEADPPRIFKIDANTSVIMWVNFASDRMNRLELTDYAERQIVDRLSVLDGVARVRVSGGRSYAMRVWLDYAAMQARNITTQDIEDALEAENIELPAGRIESVTREFTLRLARHYTTPEAFATLVIGRSTSGALIRLGDVANIMIGAADDRSELRGNGEDMVSLGIIKQSTANTLAVANLVNAEVARLMPNLPEGAQLYESYDTSKFIAASIREVYITLGIAMAMVVLVIYLFLGTIRATLVPAITVPVSLIASFILLNALGYSLNLLTLLAFVLAIGLVVDDSIIMLENIQRRINAGERRLRASYLGARQVAFAVVATTLVLVAVFVPITFLEGNIGRLFTEFAFAMIAAVSFSSLVALTLSPMLCSKLLLRGEVDTVITCKGNAIFEVLSTLYGRALSYILHHKTVVFGVFLCIIVAIGVLGQNITREFVPKEDRGVFFVRFNAPEGASFQYAQDYARVLEKDLLPLVENGEAKRMLMRVPGSFSSTAVVNSGIAIVVLEDWGERRSVFDITNELRGKFKEYVGVKTFPITPQGLGQRSTGRPVEFVIGGGTYEELSRWRDMLVAKAKAYDGLEGIDTDYKETKPQIIVKVDTLRAAELGVSVEAIGETLETLLASRRVTTFPKDGEEYDVILEADVHDFASSRDLEQVKVRSDNSGALISLANLVTFEEVAVSPSLNRYNRIRAVTLSANVADGYSLGEALAFLEQTARETLPESAQIDYRGQSLEFKQSSDSSAFIFGMALLIVFLVLAAQFESFLHPLTIMLTVPLALFGGLAGLWVCGLSLNIYSQIGLVMLIGLAAKNGILIVEFANQLRDQGQSLEAALRESAMTRLRPILMTSLTTMMGAVPLLLASGAGAESRYVLGIVIVAGVAFSTLFTLFLIPAAYAIIGRYTGKTGDVERNLLAQLDE